MPVHSLGRGTQWAPWIVGRPRIGTAHSGGIFGFGRVAAWPGVPPPTVRPGLAAAKWGIYRDLDQKSPQNLEFRGISRFAQKIVKFSKEPPVASEEP